MKHLCLMVAALTVALPVFAQSGMQQKIETRFAAADTDHDGKLTRSEAAAGMPMVARHFDEIDSGHLGYLTLDQIEQFASQHQHQRQQ